MKNKVFDALTKIIHCKCNAGSKRPQVQGIFLVIKVYWGTLSREKQIGPTKISNLYLSHRPGENLKNFSNLLSKNELKVCVYCIGYAD